MQKALQLAEENVQAGGGPFGAVVAKEGELLARGANRVVPGDDPTAHAEIVAIRRACQVIGDFSLDGCVLYASCEPCPMCLGAVYWARVGAVYYAATRADAAHAGFDDAAIYDEIQKPPGERQLPMQRLLPEEGRRPFTTWDAHEERVTY